MLRILGRLDLPRRLPFGRVSGREAADRCGHLLAAVVGRI